MKNLLIASFFVIFLISLVSCNKVTNTETTVKTTITEPGADGFLLSKQVVVKGNTVWGFSQKVYGTGTSWRKVVEQNPFLQQPGRVYYNEARKQWIVLIYPGEVLKIGNEVITPSYVVEETTTKTTTEPAATMTLWGWILVGLGAVALIALLVWLFGFYRPMNVSSSSNSSAIIRMDIPNGLGIDAAMTAAIITEERKHRETVLDKMFAHGSVKNFTMDCPDFYLNGEYKGCKNKEKKNEPKIEEK